MQPPLAAPREHLTLEQLQRLLASPALFVGTGLDLLKPDLTLAPGHNLTPYLMAGAVTHDLLAQVHGSCELELDVPLRWGLDLVRPYMVLTDGRVTARFDQGVYVPTTPRRQVGKAYEVTGYDRLYLLDRQVGADYSAPAGMGVLAAVEQAVADSGLSGILLDGTARAATIPDRGAGEGMGWPLVPKTTDPDDDRAPVTWLRVINDLLRLINYRGVWCDETGRFRSEPYRPPAERRAEWTFTTAPVGVPVGLDRDVVHDVHGIPNRWTFVASNPPEGVVPSLANGLVYQYDLPAEHPQSAANRNGLLWPEQYEYDVASAAALKGRGDARVQLDLAGTERYELSTRVFPLAWHADVLAYSDREAGVDRKAQAIRSVVDLFGADTEWTWEAAA